MVEVAFTRGAILGRKYTLEETLREGPSGPVFAAEERFRGRRVALKIVHLPPSIRVRQFVRDAEAAQAVRSTHVIFVYDVGVEGDTPYVAMELLAGRNLAELVAERGPLPVKEAIGYVLQACNGLQELRAARVVHRHVKPSNLFLTKGANGEPLGSGAAEGEPLIKLVDIGISSTELAIEAGEGALDRALLDSLRYAAPEKLRARSRTGAAPPAAVDARADVWSLAVTLHVLVSGKHPFDGSSAAEIRAAIATGVREKLRTFAPDVPQGLDLVLDRALSPAPEDRTASIAEFAQALGPFVSGRSPSNSAASRDEVHAPDVEAPSVETPSVEAPSVDTEGPAPTAPAQSAPAQAAPRAVSSPAEPVLRSEPAPKPESDAGAPSEPEPSPPISSPPAHPDATAPGATTMLPPPIAMTLLPPRGFPRKPLWAAFAVVGVLVLGGLASLLFRAPPSSDADAIHEATPEAPIAPAPRESIAPSEAPATASPEPEPEPSAAPDAQDASPSSPHHARRR